MKYLSSITIAVFALFSSTSQINAQQQQRSFQQQYNQLGSAEKAQIKASATKKEDYSQMPSIKVVNDSTVHEFCKLLPRGLETLFTMKVASNKPAAESRRAHLWAQYLSCKDSLLYYQGHRFFDSGHYSETEISSAITEIEKVMNWLLGEEAKLDAV